MNFRVKEPLDTFHYEKGYLNLAEGRNNDELFVHIFLYEKTSTKDWVKAINNLQITSLEAAAEYIPEIDSWCLTLTRPEIQSIRKLLAKKLKLLFSELLDTTS